MSKYWLLFKNYLTQHLIYRARVAIWFLFDSLHFLVFPFLWLAIYGARDSLSGFNRPAIITYYIVAALISTLATCHSSRLIRLDIVRGELNQHLVKPWPYLLIPWCRDFSFHLLIVPFTVLLLLAAHLIFPRYVSLPAGYQAGWFLLAVALSYLLSSALELALGLSAFWLGETVGLGQVKNISEIIFSGQLAPLIFLPAGIRYLADWLPFKYLVYFPAQTYLGQLSALEFQRGLIWSLVWLLAFSTLVLVLWRRGQHRYDGAGA